MTTWVEYNHFLGNMRVKECMEEKEIQIGRRSSFYRCIFGQQEES
jgi:hypothetical protein